MILFFFIYKALRQINNKSIECFRARTVWMRFTRDRTFFPPLWTDEQCDQAAKTSKKNQTLDQKWLCNSQWCSCKQILLGVIKNCVVEFGNVEKTKCMVFKISRPRFTVSSVHTDGSNMLQNVFSTLTRTPYMFL